MTDNFKPDETGTLYSIRYNGNGVEYRFTDDATDWEKEAVREFGVSSKDEVSDALAWREATDEIDNEQAARVMRGKHPTDEDKEIARPKNPGNRPGHAGPS